MSALGVVAPGLAATLVIADGAASAAQDPATAAAAEQAEIDAQTRRLADGFTDSDGVFHPGTPGASPANDPTSSLNGPPAVPGAS